MRLLSRTFVYTLFALVSLSLLSNGGASVAPWSPLPVSDDPLVRMPGTQPDTTAIEGANRCLNCHDGYDPVAEPGSNWRGSMMSQASRDPLFWACLTVSAQDSIWAIGRPNATDLCLRCHFPQGWVEGRSDPTNATEMRGSDFDGVQCDFCHSMVDPHFQDTYDGVREGNEWLAYWDETNASNTPSQPAADETHAEDAIQMQAIEYFDGEKYFGADNKIKEAGYTEAASGQYYLDKTGDKRGPFADAWARHRMLYSRFHKSKYFCATCHDVSNPVLANLAHEGRLPGDGGGPLPTESDSASSYFHVERTFSEFQLSKYGAQGGAPGVGPFDPSVFETSMANNYIARCQDCHMPDVTGRAANKKGAILRKAESVEHPESGVPKHDLTGGNIWITDILASSVQGSPNFDQTNHDLLWQGPGVLTLDMTQGLGVEPGAMLAGRDRAKTNLENAAAIRNVGYAGGDITFEVVNQTGHKLISGFPEGRRMFVNIKVYDADGNLIWEVNPYDDAGDTLKGLHYTYDGDGDLPDPAALGATEEYVDELVYEMHPGSSLTGEDETFHFVLGDSRYKDNRIPPEGFDTDTMAARHCQPRWGGVDAPGYFTAAEYAGGYDAVTVTLDPAKVDLAAVDGVEVKLYYQVTSREYLEFLRNEIRGTGTLTLPSEAYIAQTDPWFAQLKAWGDTIWDLWVHNRDVAGGSPYLMTDASWGTPPGGGGGDSTMTIDTFETGKIHRGQFNPGAVFAQGDTIAFRTRIVDADTNDPVAGATVEVTVTGPQDSTFTADTDSDGYATATWKTDKPKGRNPGTPPGGYTATVTGVTHADFTWDGTEQVASFTIE